MLELIVVVSAIVLLYNFRLQGRRLAALEAEVARLSARAAARTTAEPTATEEPLVAASVAFAETSATDEAEDAIAAGPWAAARSAGAEMGSATTEAEDQTDQRPAAATRPDLESAIGTRWAVWVGGIALALGGVFLVRYSIEAGIFGPEVRIAGATLFGLALAAVGEFARRRGFGAAAIGGIASTHIPAILTAASAFTLFGAIFAAHALYGFIGPTTAFLLLAAIGAATLLASLVHGQALAGLGLLGSYATPMLVASEAPSAWTLFGYLTVSMAFAMAIAARRRWWLLAVPAVVGSGLWCLLYLAFTVAIEVLPLAMLQIAVMAAVGFLWLRAGGEDDAPGEPVAVSAALFGGLVALLLSFQPSETGQSGAMAAVLILAAMAIVAALRGPGLPLLYGAGIAAMLAQAQVLLSGRFAIDLWQRQILVEGSWIATSDARAFWWGAGFALAILAIGVVMARRLAAAAPGRAASFAAFASLVPLVTLASAWLSYANLDVDAVYALVALLLAAVLGAAGEAVAAREDPPRQGRLAASLLLAGAAAAMSLALIFGLGPFWTTIATALAATGLAALTLKRGYPVLGWAAVGLAAVTAARIALDPTLVGAGDLSTTPVLNALTPGYMVPAAAFAAAAWLLARTTAGRPMFVMQAFAVLATLVGVGMLVRHAMTGGVIVAGEPTLAEQAIYTLIAIGAGGVLLALDARSPSPIFRLGSIGVGVLSALSIVLAHLIVLNPVATDEPTGTIPVINLLLLAYLMPALAMATLGWLAQEKRPRWYVNMLWLGAAALGFAYVTLSVRRLFQGELLGAWRGVDPLETYTYSAVWLVAGVAVLFAGLRLNSRTLRLASAILVVAAVAKVFLYDMSELEGVLRALSFMGLGVVLIGIGIVYQRMLTPGRAPAAPPALP